jgi:hypothetical protein
MDAEITIRPFAEHDAAQVRELFITVNRLLSPPNLRDAFEAYIERALREEIDRIPAYYSERNGGFWSSSMATQWSAHSGWNAPQMTRWNCGACTLILLPDDVVSLDRCSNSRKTNAAVEKSHGLSLAPLKYNRPRSHYTEMQDIDWFVTRLSKG